MQILYIPLPYISLIALVTSNLQIEIIYPKYKSINQLRYDKWS